MSDNLVFWRTYGREGRGCSLTLHIPQELKENGQIQNVLYGVNKVRRTDDLLKRALETLKPILDICEEEMDQVRQTLLDTIEEYVEKIRYLFKKRCI